MTSQSSLMVAARLDQKSVGGLKSLLATMNAAPGRADAANSMVPFGQFGNLHFARFVILDDQTLDDIELLYKLPRVNHPLYLAFLCDFDGDKFAFLNDLIQRAGSGLRAIFSFCEDFPAGVDLRQWIQDHDVPVATNYVNWRGRTMQQIREELALRQAIGKYLDANASTLENQPAGEIRALVRGFVRAEIADGRLALTPPEPTPWSDKIANIIHLVGAGLLIALLLPVAVVLLFVIRARENTEPVFAPRPEPEQALALAEIEDYEFTNQFSAIGSWKPGLVRRWMVRYVLLVIDWTARHWLYTRGRLARVRTIHCARWVYLDNMKRVFFATNYDGSLDSYNDDFINKVSIGLNVVFASGIGYPATRWLVTGGAKDEQKFKYFLRRHQLPSQVWYNGHPSVAAIELERNSRIRQGLEASTLSEEKARAWVQLL